MIKFIKNLFGKTEQQESQELKESLQKTKSGLLEKISRAIAGKSKIDDDFLDELEAALISADVGVTTTVEIINRLQKRVKEQKFLNTEELYDILQREIENMIVLPPQEVFATQAKPYVIMVVGVNGVGKTTTIGKLANMFKQSGYSVILGAADTFRAAAIDQLKVWADRVGVPVIAQQQGADPASVAFDTLQSATSKNIDVVIIDTAGRLHNKINLMNELSKVRNVMKKIIPDAPHEVLLVLDATTGQNAFEQCKQFSNATQVTGIVLTKLDGTAKGGVAIGLSHQFKIPIKYIGTGEKITDIQLFDSKKYLQSIFQK
ncbi:MAG: signal recognition particle-docking protein FtsY [Bacteroidetes bacterium]|jgi:fused signal recognition particle receptor|nr:MAG: signal recognition particle-docking protein FtsY [Bacteroidota bacterium]